jgi:predicted metal-dependent phosphoesterase TrpH
MKADLHVHSFHSGLARNWAWLHARECYSTPEEVYRVARARGMDLVCITDHDSIDGCLEFLERRPDAPDFIIGEEISCLIPDAPDLRVHLGAIGMTETLHRDVQGLRDNVFDVAAYLHQHGVFCVMNHLFMLYGGQLDLESYVRRALTLAPGLETHNGAMLATHNDLVAELAAATDVGGVRPVAVGGSDAHLLRYVGTAYTSAPGTTREEFLHNLRLGNTETGGAHGGRLRLLVEVYGSVANHWMGMLGVQRNDFTWQARLSALVCSAALLPFQFVPAIVALGMKHSEAARVGRYRKELAATDAGRLLDPSASPLA